MSQIILKNTLRTAKKMEMKDLKKNMANGLLRRKIE